MMHEVGPPRRIATEETSDDAEQDARVVNPRKVVVRHVANDRVIPYKQCMND